MLTAEPIINDIKDIITQSRETATPIANALRSQLNWMQYPMLLRIDDMDNLARKC